MNIGGTAKKYLIGAAFTCGLLMSTGIARAATCTDVDPGVNVVNISLYVVATPTFTNSGCEVGTDQNDSQAQVNLDTMNGYGDWLFAGKDDGVNGQETSTSIPINLVLTGGTIAGNWSINSTIFTMYEMVMLVFKDGQDLPPFYVGYLFDVADGTSGAYASPFSNSNNGNAKDISHVSAYVRLGRCDAVTGCGPNNNNPVVPIPAALPLLLGGLGGLGWLARRQKRKGSAAA